MRLTARIYPGEKYVLASCPEVPGANGQGTTQEEASEDLIAAIELLFEVNREDALRDEDGGAEAETVDLVAA